MCDEQSSPASRHVHIFCIGICVLFAIWVWLLNPIDMLYNDQLNIVTLQLAEDHPQNFANDPIYGGNASDFYPQLYRTIIKGLTEQFGLVGGHRAGQFPLMVGYLVVMYFVLYALTRSAAAAVVVALFSSLWHDCMGGSYWGMDRMQAVQPRSFVLIWVPLLLLLAWKFRRSWWLLLVFAMIGVLLNISPPGALFFAMALWCAMLFESKLTKHRMLLLSGAGVALIIGALPFIWSHITARTGNFAVLSLQEQELFMEALQFRFSRMSSYPVPLSTVSTVMLSFSLPLLLATAGWAVRGQKRNNFDRCMLIFFLITAIGFVVMQYVMQEVSTSLKKAPPIVNIHRGQKYAYLILYIYSAVFVRHLLLRMGRIERRALIAVIAVVLAAMPVIAFAGKGSNAGMRWKTNIGHFHQLMKGEKIETIGWYSAVVPVSQWFRENTPPDSLVLFGRNHMSLFRIYSLRSMVSSAGGGGIAFYNGPKKLIYWFKAQKVLEQINSRDGVAQLVKLAEQTNSDYIIMPRSAPAVTGWYPVAYDRYWIVYALQPNPTGKPVFISEVNFPLNLK